MNLTRKIVEDAAIGVAVCDDLTQVINLQKPGVAATIWQRNLPEGFQLWIDSIPVNRLPSARVLTKTEDIRDSIKAVFNYVHVPFSMNRFTLIDDVELLAKQFADLMSADVLRIRFDVVKDDACRKFHIDAVTARLVCTYRGPGTQYGISIDGAEPKRVFSVSTGSPFIMRGTKWPEQNPSGLLHRSPPIEGTDTTRLVLVIDPIFDDAEAVSA